jgi:biotin operon repressor
MSAIGKLYFVQESPVGEGGGAFKIGFTEQSVEKRVHQLQNGNPRCLVIRAVVPGTVNDEMLLHAKFDVARVYGTREWFLANSLTCAYVSSLPPYEPPPAMRKSANQRALSGLLTAKDDWRCNRHPGAEYRLEKNGRYAHQRRCCECLKERRAKQRTGSPRGRKRYAITDAQLIEIKELLVTNSVSQQKIGERFGVSQGYVSLIKRGIVK